MMSNSVDDIAYSMYNDARAELDVVYSDVNWYRTCMLRYKQALLNLDEFANTEPTRIELIQKIKKEVRDALICQ